VPPSPTSFDGVRDTVVPNTGNVVRSAIFHSVGTNLNGVDLTPRARVPVELFP